MEIGCILSDDELIAAVKSAVDDVCRTGGKSLVLRVPTDPYFQI